MTIDTRPVVISGPSGVGKGTLIDMLLESHPTLFTKTVSHTTRLPRAGEKHDTNYFYISEAEFTSLVSRDAFIEHTQYSGNYYGTSVATVTDQTAKGRIVILEIDIAGAKQVRERGIIDARYVFIRSPSLEALETRLRGRGSETEDSVKRRLFNAEKELEQVRHHQGLYDSIIVSDGLDRAYKELEQFVLGKPALPQ